MSPLPAAVPPRPSPPVAPRAARLSPVLLVVPALLIVVGAAAAFGIVQRRSGAPGVAGSDAPGGVSSAEVSAIALDQTRQQAAARFGRELRDGKTLDLPLTDAAFARASFTWDDPAHVTSIYLQPRAGELPKEVTDRLRAQLGSAFRGQPGSFQLAADGVSCSVSSGVSLGVHERDDPRWKARLAAVWTAVKHAAFGAPTALDPATRRDALNLGYDIAQIPKIDPKTSVDDSEQAARRVFPGSVTRGAAQIVGVDHPWFASATLTWQNQRGGTLEYVNLYYSPELAGKPPAAALRRCLEPIVGTPTERVEDHVAKRVALDWTARRGFPRIYAAQQLVMVFHEASGKARTGSAEWRRVLVRLAECGRA